ncbi:MAG: hypothetical protein RR889_02575 [Akkermansia sp.]
MITSITETDLTPQQIDLWTKSRQAIDINNYGYAVNLLKALVKQTPGFLKGRKELRACEIRLNPEPKKKSLFGGMRLTTVKRDPVTALSAVEDDLENDPYNEAANEILFNAGMEAQLPDVAAFALETIRKGHPQNKKMLHLLASHYTSRNMPLEASGVYHDIVLLDPSDTIAVKGEKDCTARASMQSQNWENAESIKDVMKDSSESSLLDKGDKQGMTKQEMESRLALLSARYAANQQDLPAVRSIAGVYEQMEDWANSYSFYNYAYSLSSSDVSLKTKAGEMYEKMRAAELTTLEKQLAENPDNAELKAQFEAKQKELSEEKVTDAKARVENNPTDPLLRFELGQALFLSGNFSDAIPELQRARNNPYLRIKAMLMLGKCYESKGMNDMALNLLSEANNELNMMDATKEEILYIMGTLNEKLDKKKEALDCFKTIYDSHYGYKDVAQRVESAYQN